MSDRLWWQHLNQRLGFFQDERARQVHTISIRNGYLTVLVTALLVGTYQEFLTDRTGVLGTSVILIWLSLLILAGRRLQLGRLGHMDERMNSLMGHAFRSAYLFLSFSIFLQASYRFWFLGDSLGLVAWNACLLSGLMVILMTQIIKNTLLGYIWAWLVPVTLLVGMAAWNIFLIIPFILDFLRQGKPLTNLLVPLMFGFAPVLGITIVLLLGAWRSWQNEREVKYGK